MEEIRISKFISAAGLMSRRSADEQIEKGNVTVNGEKAVLGMKIDPEKDEVRVSGRLVGSPERHVYIMLNKPVGYITTLEDDRGRKCVSELVSDVGVRVYPVGRLDMDSEGLLIMTNDGALAEKLMHPRYGKTKVYHVRAEGDVSPEKLARLCKPFDIDGYITNPAAVSVVRCEKGYTVLSFTLSEGRNRQIRRMCEQTEIKILSLKRISVGPVNLGNLLPGKWRYLTETQVKSLKAIKEVKKC